MATTLGPLKNVNLLEAPLPASIYNALANIEQTRDDSDKHATARTQLLNLIADHDLSHIFSVHLVHKHYPIPEGRVMVYQRTEGQNHSYLLCTSRSPEDIDGLRGMYFMAAPKESGEGKMVAYEYTNEAGADLSAHEGFVSAFVETATRLGVEKIFALTAVPVSSLSNALAEVELPSHSSTVLVSESLLPEFDGMPSSETDWVPGSASPEASVPGTVTTTVTCFYDRAGNHNYHGDKRMADNPALMQIMNEAMQLIESF
jgi:hypothetical protein